MDSTLSIQCELDEVSLDHNPQYAAISYTWGDQELLCPIECNERKLLVTPNCLAALRHLRNTSEIQTFWIDSICIDQTSLEERSQQVALMGEIYRSANRVLVWLGEHDERTRKAMNCIAEIADSKGFDPGVFQTELHRRVDILKRDTKTASDDPIDPIFQRLWFKRLWTIQEVVIARGDNVTFHCGDETLSWLDIIAVADALQARKYPFGQHRNAMRVLKYLSMMMMARRDPFCQAMLEDKPGHTVTKPHMSHILQYARGKAASDSKDKVYALYGVLEELGFTLKSPDYNKSIEDIFREATVDIIKNDRDLFILTRAPSDNRLPKLSSWVPDWREKGWQDADPRTAVTYGRFCACGPTKSAWKFSADERLLIVSGKIIDKIAFCATSLNTKIDELKTGASNPGIIGLGFSRSVQFQRRLCDSIETFHHWVQIAMRCARYPTTEDIKGVLKRALVQDFPEMVGSPNFDEDFEAWYEVMTTDTWVPLQLVNRFLPSLMEQVGEKVQRTDHEARTLKLLSREGGFKFHSIAMACGNRKRLITTEHGYLGTAPDLVKENDCIAVISGLSMPTILRPATGNTYRLVTHAYVHGYMYGEVWPEDGTEVEGIPLI